MSKMYRVKFNFIYDQENPVFCETFVEADNFLQAQFEAYRAMSLTLELCSVSEDDE